MVGTLAQNVGKGLLAGLFGTAAMTVSSTLEAKLRNREPSTAPARAAEKVLGIESFESPADENRFSNLVHWGYGTCWGAVRGVIASAGLPPRAATVAHLAAIWGQEIVMLPALDVAPPINLWGKDEIAIDLFHHVVYATATGIAYELLDGSRQL
jgi:hypothetical protein